MLFAVAGPSGSGKSTLAWSLKKNHPDSEILHFDDYQKDEPEVPMFHSMRNWDHPDAIDFDSLVRDLKQLLAGSKVSVMTKCSILNPDYEKKGRISRILYPKKLIILEGYLALHDERIRRMCDLLIYLDIAIDLSIMRRSKVTYYDESEYNDMILKPMHQKYVMPQKEFADLVIDAGLPVAEVLAIMEAKI